MTNLFLKFRKNQKGVGTLIFVVILMVVLTIIILFSAMFGLIQQKITSNQYRASQAYQAAEAGLEFAIPYLQQNSATILASQSAGFLTPTTDSNLQNVSLSNGTKYTIVYSNPTAYAFTRILITVTGTSADGLVNRTIVQLVQYGSVAFKSPTGSIITKGAVTMGGNATVRNTTSNQNIQSGSSITINGSAQTLIGSGVGSNHSALGGDVQQNVSSLSSQSATDLFSTYFGVSETIFKNNAGHYYSNSTDTTYNTQLNGLTNTTIWIDQTGGQATLSDSTVLGSSTQPVILVVNGNFFLSGSATIYGMVFVIGGTTTTDIIGNSQIIGSVVTTENLSLSGSTTINFNSPVLSSLQQNLSYYAKIPGSWKDF